MSNEKRTCLVVGSGYVGSCFAAQVSQAGWDVTALRRSQPNLERSSGIRLVQGCASTWIPDQTYDVIAYCISADQSSDEAYKAAYFDTLKKVAGWQPKHGHLVVLSSTSVYPNKDGKEVDETCAELEESRPSRWIVQGENAALATHAKVSILRLGGIYGPGRDMLIRRVQEKAVIKKSTAYSNRSYRDDVAAAMQYVIEKSLTGVFNCTDPNPTRIDKVYEWLAEKTQSSIQWQEPSPEGGSAAAPLRGNKKVLSSKLAGTGFEWKFPSYKEGFADLMKDKDI